MRDETSDKEGRGAHKVTAERVPFESTSRQHAETEVEELCGRTCERLIAAPGGSEDTVAIFYLRADGAWFRGFLDEGVLFLAGFAPDPEDDLEGDAEYLDLGAALGVQGVRVRRFVMRDGVLRVEFDAGQPLVLHDGGDEETRWRRPGVDPPRPPERTFMKPPRGFQALRERGATPSVAYRIALAWQLDGIECIRMLRLVYGLSLREAKEVRIVESGAAASLDEYEAGFVAELKDVLDEERRASCGHEGEFADRGRRTGLGPIGAENDGLSMAVDTEEYERIVLGSLLLDASNILTRTVLRPAELLLVETSRLGWSHQLAIEYLETFALELPLSTARVAAVGVKAYVRLPRKALREALQRFLVWFLERAISIEAVQATTQGQIDDEILTVADAVAESGSGAGFGLS